MLKLEIEPVEVFNDADDTFAYTKAVTLSLEHSLVSVSKWESKWCVPFLSNRNKSSEEVMHYIKCMTLTQNVDDEVYTTLNQTHFDAIKNYINASMTATTITTLNQKTSREIITSEIIYYWMIALNVPFECQKWHLNRLLTLISVCDIKQQDPKKLRGRALNKSNSALNAQRRALANSTG